MEVIDVKAAKEYVMGNYPNDPLLKHIATSLLDQLPQLEAEVVIRCKDCKHRSAVLDCGNYLCNRKMFGMVRPDDFCSFGEMEKDG
jgi:hypothetical protein